MKIGKDVKLTMTQKQKMTVSPKTIKRLKKEMREAKMFKVNSYVEITGGKYALGKKGIVVGHHIARESKKHAPHVFVVVMVGQQGVLKYPKNLKIISPSYIS